MYADAKCDLTAGNPGTGAGQINIVEEQIILTITGWVTGGKLVIYDDDSADPQELGTELQRNDNLTPNETYLYESGKANDDLVIVLIKTGYNLYQETVILTAASVIHNITPIVETN